MSVELLPAESASTASSPAPASAPVAAAAAAGAAAAAAGGGGGGDRSSSSSSRAAWGAPADTAGPAAAASSSSSQFFPPDEGGMGGASEMEAGFSLGEEIDLATSIWTLRFKQDWLEERLEERWAKENVGIVRRFTPLLLLAYIALVVSDLSFLDGDRLRTQLMVRFAVQVPVTLLLIAYSWTPLFMRHSQGPTAFVAYILGVTNVMQSVIGENPDHGPHMLFFFVVFMFLRVRFFLASCVCWLLLAVYVASVNLLVPVDRLREGSGVVTSPMYLGITVLCLMFASYFLEYFNRMDAGQHILVEKEQLITYNLLNSLLPRSITEQLKTRVDDSVIAQKFDSVSILFSDLVGFTAFCATIPPSKVVDFLNELYSKFDQLTDQYEAYKVETIGDAYFVAAGVPEPCDNHAEQLALMATAMHATLRTLMLLNGQRPIMRIGIHSGSVVAGVVGKKMPRYHLFGDTVTIAEMMESEGVPGRTQVSQAAQEFLHSLYFLELRPKPVQVTPSLAIRTFLLGERRPPRAPSPRRRARKRGTKR